VASTQKVARPADIREYRKMSSSHTGISLIGSAKDDLLAVDSIASTGCHSLERRLTTGLSALSNAIEPLVKESGRPPLGCSWPSAEAQSPASNIYEL
jgi:hypothetical protein